MHVPRPRRAPGALLALAAVLTLTLPAATADAATGTTTTASASTTVASTAAWTKGTPPLSTPWTADVSPTNALPDYPRPQLARPSAAAPEWANLNGLWQYQPWDGFSPLPFGTDLAKQILVPYPTESALSGIQAHSDYMVYRRTVTVPDPWKNGDRRIHLNFGAVDYEATVYVNGREVAHHTGGYTAFTADITDALVAKGPQEILVAVHAPANSENIPVGKQSLTPGGIFYTASSGIWQTVWMEPVSTTSISALTATPTSDLTGFDVRATTLGDAADARLRVTAFADGQQVGSAEGPAGQPLHIGIDHPHLWTPDDPFLYTFTATLTGAGRADQVESYAGLRTIAVANLNGKQRITLNGKQQYLLATLDQGFWPDGIYTAPTDAALKSDIQHTKDLGFNTIRKHIKVEPARWYYWADRLGMMVWQDAPSMPAGSTPRLNTADKATFRSQVSDIVTQLRGETSVIGWIPFNEGWGQWSIQAAADLTTQIKSLDPTRLVDSRSGANCCDMAGDPGSGNIIDWHQYQGPALPSPDANRAAIDGEHGGLTLPVAGHAWPGADVNPYGAVKDSAALTQGYVDNTTVLKDYAPWGLSGSVYTQITDVEGEQNGFWTYDRQVLKVDPAPVRAINLATIAAGSSSSAPQPPAGTPGLNGIGHWPLDDGSGTTATDVSGSHPLTVVNGAWSTDGLTFTGNGYAHSSGPVIATQGTDYAVSAWVKLAAAGGGFQTVVSEDGVTNSAFFLQYSGADHLWAFSFAGTRALATGVGTPVVGRWYHLVGVRDVAASTLTLYVDGQQAGVAHVLGSVDAGTGDFTVGRGRYGGNPVDYLTGTVDDVRAYDRALSSDEVAQLFAAGRV